MKMPFTFSREAVTRELHHRPMLLLQGTDNRLRWRKIALPCKWQFYFENTYEDKKCGQTYPWHLLK